MSVGSSLGEVLARFLCIKADRSFYRTHGRAPFLLNGIRSTKTSHPTLRRARPQRSNSRTRTRAPRHECQHGHKELLVRILAPPAAPVCTQSAQNTQAAMALTGRVRGAAAKMWAALLLVQAHHPLATLAARPPSAQRPLFGGGCRCSHGPAAQRTHQWRRSCPTGASAGAGT